MTGPSPAFRAFVAEAVRLRLARAHTERRFPDARLRYELGILNDWLATGTWADLAGPGGAAVAAYERGPHAESVTPSVPMATSLREAAAALGVSLRTVERLVATGMLASVKRGGRRLVLVDALRDYLSTETERSA